MLSGDVASCLKRVNKYVASENFNSPFFINVNNQDDYLNISEKLPNGYNRVGISTFCNKPDALPQLDELFNYIHTTNKNITLVGLCSYLKILGEKELHDSIATLFSIKTHRKIVVLCFQFQQILDDMCRDLRKKRRVFLVQGQKTPPVRQLIFIPPELNIIIKESHTTGIQEMLMALETNPANDITTVTKHKSGEFNHSLIPISVIDSYYSALLYANPSLEKSIKEENGTAEQWKHLLSLLNQEQSLDNVFKKVFFCSEQLESLFHKWGSFSSFDKWLYFITLKIKKPSGDYINNALENAANMHEFIRAIFRNILNLHPFDIAFDSAYRERKELARALSSESDELYSFCRFAESKGIDKIYYLTDNTSVEKTQIIEALSRYDYPEDDIPKILRTVYPDMANYISPYHFNIPLLDNYFQRYKYQKIKNRIYPEFLNLVNEQAGKREYNAILPYRSEIFEKIDVSKAYLYFVDALGVEYLGFIMQKCNELKLYAKVSVCHANLPSITSWNKEFLEYFTEGNNVFSVKELDDVKHKGKEDFDYQKTKLPIHIRRELEIIDEVLTDAKNKLSSGNYKNIIIASDHGASRLAVIHESFYKYDVDSKGTHGGRCCAYSPNIPEIPYAIKENEYYVLANYDRFKGGRPGSVEAHGGATLEEVVIPVIELRQFSSKVEARFIEDVVKVSYRQKAQITLFVITKLNSPILSVNDTLYQGTEIEGHKYRYSFTMTDIKKPGVYVAKLYDENNVISDGLTFKVEKEGSTINDIL